MVKKYLYSTYSSFLVINVCNQEKILCLPCILSTNCEPEGIELQVAYCAVVIHIHIYVYIGKNCLEAPFSRKPKSV